MHALFCSELRPHAAIKSGLPMSGRFPIDEDVMHVPVGIAWLENQYLFEVIYELLLIFLALSSIHQRSKICPMGIPMLFRVPVIDVSAG